MWYSDVIIFTTRHLSALNCAFLQQILVRRFSKFPELPDIMGSNSFNFAIKLRCLIFKCEHLLVDFVKEIHSFWYSEKSRNAENRSLSKEVTFLSIIGQEAVYNPP
jgi:hypothetical protein